MLPSNAISTFRSTYLCLWYFRLGGSTAFQPLASKIAESYHNHCPGANFSFVPTKSETGLDSVEDGSIDIGDSDTYSTPGQAGLVDEQVAIVIFAVIINSGVGITNLTTSQLQGIYSGKYTNWKDLGGPDLKINALSRTTGSGTRFTFDKYILGTSERLSQPAQMKSTPEMIQKVQRIQGAIGYAALHDVQANQQSLITVNIDGEPASPATVTTNSYRFWTIEHMYTKQGQTSQLAMAFINYMGSSDARQIIQNLSFANIHDTNSSTLSARCPTN